MRHSDRQPPRPPGSLLGPERRYEVSPAVRPKGGSGLNAASGEPLCGVYRSSGRLVPLGGLSSRPVARFFFGRADASEGSGPRRQVNVLTRAAARKGSGRPTQAYGSARDARPAKIGQAAWPLSLPGAASAPEASGVSPRTHCADFAVHTPDASFLNTGRFLRTTKFCIVLRKNPKILWVISSDDLFQLSKQPS